MRKTTKKPTSTSWRQFIFGPGRADALERTERILQRNLALLESSDRTEERNGEDAERRVRNNNLKDYMDDATYNRLSTKPELVDEHDDHRAWYEKAMDSILWPITPDLYLKRFIDPNVSMLDNFLKLGTGKGLVDHSADIMQSVKENLANVRKRREQKAKDKELAQYTPEALAQAKSRAELRLILNINNLLKRDIDVPVIQQGTSFDQLNRETQQSIAQRESDYRNLIGPSAETLTMVLQAKEDYDKQTLSIERPKNYFDPDVQVDRYGRIYYATSPWMRDWWSLSMLNMNTAQRDNFIGLLLRYNEKKEHALNAKKYYQALNDISNLQKLLDILNKYSNGELLSPWQEDILDNIIWSDYNKTAREITDDINARLKQAYGDNMRYKHDAEWIESYDPSFKFTANPIKFAENLISRFGTGFSSFISKGTEDWWNLSYTSNLADETRALNQELLGLKDASYQSKIGIIDKFIAEGDRKSKYWEEGARVNQEDIEAVKERHEPSDYFKYRMQTSDGKFYKPSTWMYKMPEVWGSSQASWIKLTSAMGINTIAAFATSGLSTVAVGATGFGLAQSSSVDENNAEVAENYRLRLKEMLQNGGLADQFIKSNPDNKKLTLDEAVEEYVMNPWELGNRKLQAATFNALHGVNSLYEDDMAAVLGDNIIDTYLLISPLAGVIRAAKPSTIIGVANRMGAKASTLGAGAAAGTYVGSMAATAAKRGLAKTAAGKAIAKLTRQAINYTKALPKRLLGEERYTKFIKNAKDANKNVFGTNSVPHRVLTAEQYTKYQALKDYGADVIKASIGSAISEGIEEGKLYIHGQRFIAGEYDADLHKELFNLTRLYNDTEAGIQSAIAMTSLLPLMPAMTDDTQLIENILSGMLGGLFQTGAQRAIANTIPTAQMIQMQDFIANEVVMEKQALMDVYKKAKEYTKKAKSELTVARLMLGFDRYIAANQALVDNGSEDVSQEEVDLIKEQKRQALHIIDIAQNKETAARANRLGIDVSSEKYNQYIAALAMFEDSKTEASNRHQEAKQGLQEEVAKTDNPFTLNEDGAVVRDMSVAGAIRLQTPVNMTDENGNELSGQALLDAAIQRRSLNITMYARLAALQSLKDYLTSTLADNDLDKKTVRDLKYQLKRVDRHLRAALLSIKPEYREDVVKNAAKYIRGLENADAILSNAHKVITSQIDLDYHDAILQGLRGSLIDIVGKPSDNLEDLIHSGYKHPENVVDEIEATIESDYNLSENIERDWLYQYDLLDDEYLDNLQEKQRRQIIQRQNKILTENVVNDVEDVESDIEDDYDEADYAGAYEANLLLTQQEEPEIDESQFDVPIISEQPIETKKISRSSRSKLSRIRKEAYAAKAKKSRVNKLLDIQKPPKKQYKSPESTIVELDDVESIGANKQPSEKKKYTKPETIKHEVTPKMQDMFAEAEDVLQQLENVSIVDLIDVREETMWAAKNVADKITQWMFNTIVNKDESSVNEAELTQLKREAQNIFDTISEEIWTSEFRIAKKSVDFSNAQTLRRSTYLDEDVWNDRLSEEEKYKLNLKDSFRAFTNKLYQLGREIMSGQHMQDGSLDSPTTTQIDEAIATLDTLIDDAAELGIDFNQDDIAQYVAAKQWFAKNTGLTGNKSEPYVLPKPQQLETPTSGPEVGEVKTYGKSTIYGFGIDESVAEDGTKLSDVIDNPDFMLLATFTLEITTFKEKTTSVKKISVVPHYKGKTFSPITLDSSEMLKSRVGKDFYFAVKNAIEKGIPEDSVLVPGKISRTIGGQKHGSKFTSPIDKGLISTSKKEGVLNLYDIEFNGGQKDFGVTSVKMSPRGPVTEVHTPIIGSEIPNVLYTFPGERNFAGSIIMMVKRFYNEFGKNVPSVPVLLKAKRFSKGDAQLIVDVITGKFNPQGIVGRESLGTTVYLNGENTGISGKLLISILIPQTGTKDVGRSRIHFDVPYGTQKILIIGRIKNDPESMELPIREFDLATENGRDTFIKFMSENVDINLDNEFMRQRFGFAGHTTDFPFHQLIQSSAMVKRLKNGETIVFGDSSIAVDISDVINPHDKSDERGLTGLAWMMKRGLLETDFDGFNTPKLIVDTRQGARIENKLSNPSVEQLDSPLELSADQNAQQSEAELWAMFDDPYFNKVAENKKSNKPIDEKEVRAHLARILGKKFAEELVYIYDAVIDTCADGIVIGRCYQDSIILSRSYWQAGVEYHEAFHRILEILAPEKLRNIIYNAYRSNKQNAKRKSDAELAELLADDFMYYVQNRPTFKLPHSVREAFTMVKSYVDFIKSIGSFRLYLMYVATNSGLLNKVLTINKDRRKAFDNIKNVSYNKVVRGKELDHVINSAMYRDLKNSLAYLLFKIQPIDILGRDLDKLNVFFDSSRDVATIIRTSEEYKSWLSDENVPQNTKDALEQLLDNWDVVKQDVAATISKFSTDYKAVFDEENREAAEGDEESISGASIGDHTRASYEFSQFSRASSRVRFFFSAIPDRKWDVIAGKKVPKIVVNKAGLPEFTNANVLFNTILNKLHSCQTYDELLAGLRLLGQEDARMFHIYKRLEGIYNLVLSGKATAEEEAILTQIKNLIHCAKNEFMIAKSLRDGNQFTINLLATDAEYNAKQYVQGWQQMIKSGVSKYLRLDSNGKYLMKAQYKPTIFIRIAEEIENWSQLVQDLNTNAEVLKNRIVGMLLSLSIQFDKDMLNYMLRSKYGSADLVGLLKMFVDPMFTPLGLANALRTTIDANNNLIAGNIDKLLINNGFVKELANQKYQYRHAHDQLTVLATNDNRYYVMSENNYITDLTDHINRKDSTFDDLCSFTYNIYEPSDPNQLTSSRKVGSIILKYLLNNDLISPIDVISFVGFKTDEIGDNGLDYAQISLRQDYVAKAAMLLRGAMVFPTMSDKKTWVFLRGVEMPGVKVERKTIKTPDGERTIIECNLKTQDGIIPQEVVDQFWEYAICERRSIADTLAVVRGKQGSDGKLVPLSDEQKVKNYHTRKITIGDKSYDVIQGARFSSLLGVYNGGQFIEFNRVLDENGNYLSEEANLEIADQYFFSRPIEEQKLLIRQLLLKQAEQELQYVESLGLVSQNNGLYSNIGLDKNSVQLLKDWMLYGIEDGKRTPTLTALVEDLAVRIVVADICTKHIVSLQEGLRIYYGHPASYKWEYDSKGHLSDLGTDLHKRLGGLVSTGTNNDLELKDIPTNYVCAEIDDVEIASEDGHELAKLFEESEFRTTYLHKLQDDAGVSFENEGATKELAKKADSESLESIKEALGESTTQIIQKRVESKYKAFDKVNVADGASYISDTMCEHLLRMVGSWNDDVARAFKILRGEEVNGKVYTTKDIRELADAYEKVWTTVIGSQKYTAFGMRKEGNAVLPYYNKTALFPIFKSIASGHMAQIYQIMKDQGVDMLMMSSAVKLGNKGSQKIDFDNLDNLKLNTYEQRYDYLRKQFNTDPKEKETMKVGTQSAKVAMLALIPGRTYKVNGKEYSGTELRLKIMEDLNKLSDLGVKEINEEFFDIITDENGKVVSRTINIEKLSDILTEELVNRGASTELLDAVSIEIQGGQKRMKMPLAALSGLSWILSILVSRVNKRTVDINTPGNAFIQRSILGMEGPTMISDEDMAPSINNGNRLKQINDNGAMDCVLSIDFFDDLIPQIPRKDSNGNIIYQVDEFGNFILDKNGNRKPETMRMPFNQARQWLFDQGIIGQRPTIFAYRIPTQAISSIHALQCVDVLPVVRDTVMLPAEFTKITGSDKYQCSNFKKLL